MPNYSLSQEAESVVQPGILSPFPGVKGPQTEAPGSFLLPFSLVSCSNRSGVSEEP